MWGTFIAACHALTLAIYSYLTAIISTCHQAWDADDCRIGLMCSLLWQALFVVKHSDVSFLPNHLMHDFALQSDCVISQTIRRVIFANPSNAPLLLSKITRNVNILPSPQMCNFFSSPLILPCTKYVQMYYFSKHSVVSFYQVLWYLCQP